MSIWATVTDVEALYEGAVPARTQALLDVAEVRLRAKVKGLVPRLALATTDPDWLDPALLKSVIVDAVIRALRNPKGYSWEREGDYSYGYPINAKGGTLDGGASIDFTTEELDLLSPSAGAVKVGTIALGDPYLLPQRRWFTEFPDWASDDPLRGQFDILPTTERGPA